MTVEFEANLFVQFRGVLVLLIDGQADRLAVFQQN
jgi:hypothetical protein